MNQLLTIFPAFMDNWIGGLALMIVMSYLIMKACDVFELSTDYLGRNMSEGVKGATLNAVGSSMPEFLTTVFFLLIYSGSDVSEGFAASVGGDTGSAIFNSIFIPMIVIWMALATVAGLKGVKIAKKVILRDGLFLIVAEIILLVLLSSDYITWQHGAVFTLFYIIYLTYTLKSMPKAENSEDDEEDDEEEEMEEWHEKFLFKAKDGRNGRAWILLVFGTALIALGASGLVQATEFISTDFGINPLFVALILVAAASSVPDAIISYRDARKGNYDDALSNVLGSNIFDITISMGLPLMVYLWFNDPIPFKAAGETLIDIRLMLIVVTVITIAIFYKNSNKLSMRHVSMLGLLYFVFIIYSLSAASHLEGHDNVFANTAGMLVEYLNQPGGLTDTLRAIANSITGGW
jgi:Ca2+/Na+ antiporter